MHGFITVPRLHHQQIAHESTSAILTQYLLDDAFSACLDHSPDNITQVVHL